MTSQQVLENDENSALLEKKWAHRPLVQTVLPVIGKVNELKEQVKSFYYEVLLSQHQCPLCSGQLSMTGQSECTCLSGHGLDPTIAFQKSPCCGASLVRKTFHYACSNCNQVVPSRFVFDERLFDSDYFREMMKECRARSKQRKDEIRRLLILNRSDVLPLLEELNLGALQGFLEDLDQFVQESGQDTFNCNLESKTCFSMDRYKEHILSNLGWDSIQFSNIPHLAQEGRKDRAWRFITLIFLDQERVVELTQEKDNIIIQKVHNEAHA